MTARRAVGAVAVVVATTVALVGAAPPAAAHGIGERGDLPIPLWLFTYGAAAALVLSFLALRALWPRPRLAAAATGRPVWAWAQRGVPAAALVARVLGLAAFALVLAAALGGEDNAGLNLAPVAVYVVFWVGVQVVCVLLGDVWRVLSPFDTLAALGSRWRRRPPAVGRAPGPGWTAAALLGTFLWLELAYHDPARPSAVGVWLAAYTLAALAGAAVWGRAWLRRGEGFAVLFGLLGRLAPFVRGDDGRLRVRSPVAGLATTPATPGTTAVVLVTLGSTTFDGFSRTRLWQDVLGTRAGWGLTAINTVGLLWVVALVALAYVAATRAAARIGGRDPVDTALAFAGSLVPIAFAYVLAHYFSLLVFEGQRALALVSDPFGRGWDLFGSAGRAVDYGVLSPDAIAYVQAGAIVVGHVVGVVVAHDRAVERWPRRLAERTQYAMLAVMVAYTVGGLAILLRG